MCTLLVSDGVFECISLLYFAVAIDLLQNAFGVNVSDKSQADVYKLDEPLEVCSHM